MSRMSNETQVRAEEVGRIGANIWCEIQNREEQDTRGELDDSERYMIRNISVRR